MGTETLLENALKSPKPLVIGTTGLNEHQQNLLKEAANNMPILYLTNMSLGVAVLNRLVELASRSLSDFDIEIVEQHHRFEKDSWKGEIWNRKKNGEIYPEWLNISTVRDQKGNILNYVALFSDISKIKKSNEKIEFLAHHDPLTGLPNKIGRASCRERV